MLIHLAQRTGGAGGPEPTTRFHASFLPQAVKDRHRAAVAAAAG